MIVSALGLTNVAQILLDAGADPNIECNQQTALTLAKQFRHTALVKLLVERGGK